MQTPTVNTNTREKTRLRDTIADEIKRYLEKGGRITVLDSPTAEKKAFRAPSWQGADDIDLLLD